MPLRLCRECGEEFEKDHKEEDKKETEQIMNYLKEAKPEGFLISAGECYKALGKGEWRQKNEIHASGTLKDFREWFRKTWRPIIEKLTIEDYQKLGINSPSGRRGLRGTFYFAVEKDRMKHV